MKILFRQGIVSRQSGQFLQVVGDNVDLLAANRSTTVTIAIRDTDYIHSEDNTVPAAWVGPFPVDSNPAKANAYLYWDFDPLTFERTFGWTTLAPAAQSVAPGSGNTPIIGVVPTAASPVIQGSFEVSGQYVLTTGKTIAVVSSNANDGIYTVQSATYSTLTGTTTIVVKEAITSASISGSINLDFDIFGQPLKQTGRTWYDTANHIHYELNVANKWVEVIRVFAARLNNANSFFSMSKDANFTGSQIGDVSSVFAGRVLFAETNKPITRDDGTFFTTEDQFFTNQSRVDALRLESNVSRAKSVSGGTLAAFGIVQWVGEGEITTAQYNDTGSTVVGVLTEDTIAGEIGAVIIQGTVTNSAWSWDSALVGKSLWIENGALVSIDPHTANPVTYPAPQVPVARVLSGDTVIFEQGLGGTGPQGPRGTISDLPLANFELVQGVVSLSHAPLNDLFPIAAGENHPVLTSGPYSVDGHGHTAAQVSFESIPGSIDATNVQAAIAELNDEKLSLTGGIMSGILTLSGPPSDNLDAATKAYVDALAQGLDAKESAVVGTTVNFGGTYLPSGGTGGTGDITGATISSLDGVYGTDYSLIVGSRILVKDQTDNFQNGIYDVTALLGGSPPTTLNVERSSDFDENDEVRAGNYVFIRGGLVLAGTGWVLTDIHPGDDIDLNAHPIVWTLISSATSFTADETTITIDGLNEISTKQASAGGTVDALKWNSNDISLGSPPTNGQVLVYDTTGGYWTNTDLTSDICDLTVVCTPTKDTIISTKETFALNIDSVTGITIGTVAGPAGNSFDKSLITVVSTDVYAYNPNINPNGFFLSADGTRMYYVEGTTGGTTTVYTRSLGTAFDINTVTGTTADSVVGGSVEQAINITFSPDGFTMLIGKGQGEIDEFALGTAWLVSSYSFTDTATIFSPAVDTSTTEYTYFSKDGLHAYSGGRGVSRYIHEYLLGAAFDISTAAFVQTLDIGAQAPNANIYVSISTDGTQLFCGNFDGGIFTEINEWTLSPAWDVSSASFVSAQSMPTPFGTDSVRGMFWTDDGTEMYFRTDDDVFQYNTGVVGSGSTETALYHNGITSLTTTAEGVEVTGILTFVSDGSPTTSQLVFPNYTTPPSTTLDGGTIYDSTVNALKFYNGSSWIALATGTPTVALNDLTDVIVAGSPLVTDQVLTFDGTDWVNADVPASTLPILNWTDAVQIGNDLPIAGVGTPALTTLTSTTIAFAGNVSDELRTYSWNGTDWIQVGNSKSISGAGVITITTLDATNIAWFDSTNKKLETYTWDGIDWTKTGNSLTLTGTALGALTALTSTTVAFVDNLLQGLKTYSWDGTNWTQSGSTLVISATGTPKVTALDSTTIAFHDTTTDELRTYSWSGAAWSQIGNNFSVTSSQLSLSAITSTDIVIANNQNDELGIYRWDGSDWSLNSNSLSISMGNVAITAINATDVAFVDGSNTDIRTYRFDSIIGDITFSDTLNGKYVNITGDTLTGQLKGLTPVDAADLTRKDYVDSKASTLYKKFTIGGSPVSQVLDTTPLPVTATVGSPIQTANIQVFRNGILQNEDTISGGGIDGDFEVTGANELTFSADSLQPGGVVIIYVFS